MKPEPVEVRCKQQSAPPLAALPKADEWVEWVPAVTGPGSARLSKKAAAWVIDILGAYRASESLRGVEHNCLDRHEKEGLIRQ